MQQVEFKVGAKAARLIGRENIADVDGALIELIKNAYDADATCAYVDFFMPFPDVPEKEELTFFIDQLSDLEWKTVKEYYEIKDEKCIKKAGMSAEQQQTLEKILFSHNQIIVADNGSGMSLDTIKSAWMYIGTSNKETQTVSEKGRVKTGAKGIGRFALDKLSVESLMFTKSQSEEKVVQWRMNWDQFAEAQLINDVKAEIEVNDMEFAGVVQNYVKDEHGIFTEHDWSSGTIIILTPVREAWSDRLFRKVNTNLKSINPIGNADRFDVMVNNRFRPQFNFMTEDVFIDPEDFDYRIRAEFDGNTLLSINLLRNEVNLSKKEIIIEKYGISEKRSLDEFWARKKFQREGYRKKDYEKEIQLKKNVSDACPHDSLEKIQKVGPFTAEMYFLRNTGNEYAIMKKVAVAKRKKLLSQFSGIKIYRDSFKVRPYGDEGAMYDWLEMGTRAQKSPASVANQNSSWRVQPYQMIGWVKIGREANPYLEDMANREGLALTETYHIFVELLQECIEEFEFDRQYIYREYAKWIKSIEEGMGSQTEKIKEAAVQQARSGDFSGVFDNKNNENLHEVAAKDSPLQMFSEKEMLSTVYEMMEESKEELKSKQIVQALNSSGILINTFFHEFNAMNTQFHTQAPQLRSRVNYILQGRPYEGLPYYNPYDRIDRLEKNDRVTAAFLDVIMNGLRRDNLTVKATSLRKMLKTVWKEWEVLLEEKHIAANLDLSEEVEMADHLEIALVDIYIILNNLILNSVWFLQQTHNSRRNISLCLRENAGTLHLIVEDNGPGLADKFKDNPDKIFEMGVTAKGENGTGLGLWIVKEAVERTDGTIAVIEKQNGFGLEIIWKGGKQCTQ